MRISVFRNAHFNAAHRLHVPGWSDQKNLEIFGKCANPHYHGHNYELSVQVTGEVDPETGILIDLKDLKNLIRTHVEDRLDHRNLNEEIPEFEERIPTVENICYVIWTLIRRHLDARYTLKVRLYETPRNYAEYPADETGA
jgi:6-pyruvoyltetrahydropterin/6-carboxytetrahydropterin synthase